MVNTRPNLVSITLINQLQTFQLNVTFRGVIRTKVQKTNEILWRNQQAISEFQNLSLSKRGNCKTLDVKMSFICRRMKKNKNI